MLSLVSNVLHLMYNRTSWVMNNRFTSVISLIFENNAIASETSNMYLVSQCCEDVTQFKCIFKCLQCLGTTKIPSCQFMLCGICRECAASTRDLSIIILDWYLHACMMSLICELLSTEDSKFLKLFTAVV